MESTMKSGPVKVHSFDGIVYGVALIYYLVLTKVAAHASIGVRLTQQWFIGAGLLNLKYNL